MQLGPTAYVILGMLALGPRSGYDIKQLADVSTRHFWATSYGQIYPELRALSTKGLIKAEDASKGTRQRTIYHLTPKGRETLHAWVADPAIRNLEIRDEMLLKLFFADAMSPRETARHLEAMSRQSISKQHATVANLKELRRSLGDSATYTVAKNTLVKRAAAEAGIDGLDELFVGPTAIAFVKGEAVDAAKALKTFAKDNKALVIKGGYMDGRALSVSEVETIADLESREVLLAKLAGAMKANLSKAAGLFNAPASQVARLVAALQEKKAAEEAA